MEDIWLNISRQITGEASEEDREKVAVWKQEKKNRLVYQRLEEIWNSESLASVRLPFLYWRIKKRILHADHKARTKFLSIQISKIAAAVLVLLSLSFFAWHYFSDQKAVAEFPVAYNTIVVPKGNRSQIILPDSTKVWLNNATKLVFPERFESDLREVELSGEAYFEVKHDKNRPFLVKAGNSRIKVLGTTFAVSAYPDDPFIETALIEGKVIFETEKSSYELTPGYSINYNKLKNELSRQEIGSTFYDYWGKGVYSFKNESLESLARKIYRIYNVQIIFENDFLKHKTYTGTLSINDNIFTFIEAIKRTSVQPIDYWYDYNKSIIYLKWISL